MKRNITFSFEKETIEKLKKISEKTLIPQSRLVEKALKKIIEENFKPNN